MQSFNWNVPQGYKSTIQLIVEQSWYVITAQLWKKSFYDFLWWFGVVQVLVNCKFMRSWLMGTISSLTKQKHTVLYVSARTPPLPDFLKNGRISLNRLAAWVNTKSAVQLLIRLNIPSYDFRCKWNTAYAMIFCRVRSCIYLPKLNYGQDKAANQHLLHPVYTTRPAQ